jgi:hypothetical protein
VEMRPQEPFRGYVSLVRSQYPAYPSAGPIPNFLAYAAFGESMQNGILLSAQCADIRIHQPESMKPGIRVEYVMYNCTRPIAPSQLTVCCGDCAILSPILFLGGAVLYGPPVVLRLL